MAQMLLANYHLLSVIFVDTLMRQYARPVINGQNLLTNSPSSEKLWTTILKLVFKLLQCKFILDGIRTMYQVIEP